MLAKSGIIEAQCRQRIHEFEESPDIKALKGYYKLTQ